MEWSLKGDQIVSARWATELVRALSSQSSRLVPTDPTHPLFCPIHLFCQKQKHVATPLYLRLVPRLSYPGGQDGNSCPRYPNLGLSPCVFIPFRICISLT